LPFVFNKELINHQKQNISIIGGGAAALFLACKLNSSKYHITIYEKNGALGRKFLVAGKGGFNLTHAESKERFIEKYTPEKLLLKAFNDFDNTHFIVWLKSIGIQTYVGTSNRVFPKKGTKPIDVLNAIERELKKNGVDIKFGHDWKGWDEKNELVFENESKKGTSTALSVTLSKSDAVIFSLGGSSWRVTGSDGAWSEKFKKQGIEVLPFQASNCAYKINWNDNIKNKLVGEPIKNAAFSCGEKTVKGEAVITAFGIEGSGVYPLSHKVRKELEKNGKAILHIDFKPELTEAKILDLLKQRGDLNVKELLQTKINLSDTTFQLIKLITTKEEYNNPAILANLIKHYSVTITDLAPIDEAISTVGGIPFNELTENFELKKLPGAYCIGEMVDWDAPTGGYLLQMCFSMGFYLGDVLNKKS